MANAVSHPNPSTRSAISPLNQPMKPSSLSLVAIMTRAANQTSVSHAPVSCLMSSQLSTRLTSSACRVGGAVEDLVADGPQQQQPNKRGEHDLLGPIAASRALASPVASGVLVTSGG